MAEPRKKLVLGRKISKKSVFQGTYVRDKKEQPVAIKIENVKTKRPKLLHESEIYELLKGGAGIPEVISFKAKPAYNMLVMRFLGPNLEHLFSFCSRKFSLKTVLMLSEQMLNRVEFIHSKSILHRDIKPDSFVMGRSKPNQVNVVDFGLAKKYQDLSQSHIPYRENLNLSRDAIFASLNAHLGIEQSRRDDLESIGYVLIHIFPKREEIKAENKEQEYKMIGEKKASTSIEELCEGYPLEFVSYFHYCRCLKFDEEPDYAYLKKIFRDLLITKGFQFDNVFDWIMLKRQQLVMAALKVENDGGTFHRKLNNLIVGCIIFLTVYRLFFLEKR